MAIDTFINYGEDALGNHFQVIIPPLPALNGGIIDSLIFRVTSVDIPDYSIATYTITKDGKTFTRPSGVQDMANDFSFNFRIDKYFLAYKYLVDWEKLARNNVTGTMASDSGVDGIGGASTFRAPITVLAIDSNGIVTSNGWNFSSCWISSVGGVSFSEDSGDPIEGNCTVQFGDLDVLV